MAAAAAEAAQAKVGILGGEGTPSPPLLRLAGLMTLIVCWSIHY